MRFYLLFVALGFSLCTRAQEFRFSRLNVTDGLSQNSVLSVAQDKRGLIWLGTRNGLNCYDSFRFKIYKDSLDDDNYITALHCDKRGTLWVGTKNGLRILDPATGVFRRIQLKYDYTNDRASKTIHNIYEDKKGSLWICSAFTLNVITYTGNNINVSAIKLPVTRAIVRCVFEDNQGDMWIGTSDGVIVKRQSRGKNALEKIQHPLSGSNGLWSNQVTAITQDAGHNIWIGMLNGGVDRYQPETKTFTHFGKNNSSQSLANDNVRRLLSDRSGKLWVATQEGITLIDPQRLTFNNLVSNPWDNASLSQNSVHSLYEDKSGSVWVGTFFGGVNTYHTFNTPFEVWSNSTNRYRLNNNTISSILQDAQHNLWVGTEGGGVNLLPAGADKFRYLKHDAGSNSSLGSNLVKLIYKDDKDQIWIGTHGGGLNLYEPATGTFKRYFLEDNETFGSEITSMAQDRSGTYWIGTETLGLKRFKKDANGVALIPYASGDAAIGKSHILSIVSAADGSLWIGGRNGLHRLANPLNPHQRPELLSNKHVVNCIYQSADKQMWIGTNGAGLLHYNAQGKLLENVSLSNGMQADRVLGVLEDASHALWVTTGDGLYRYNSLKKSFQRYTEVDGLPGNMFNNNAYYKSPTGQMYLGGYSGLMRFNPEKITVNVQKPVMLISSVAVHNGNTAHERSILSDNAEDGIKLRYNENAISINFALLNFVKPVKNLYRYKLSGHDREWHSTAHPTVFYPNLPQGAYQFLVQGANNDNVWSAVQSLSITVTPPFWKTWWAYLFYIFAAATMVGIILRHFFLQAIYKKHKEVTQFKLNFFTNISHEIRTHLSLIAGPVDHLLSMNNQQAYDKSQLLTIKNNSESLLQLVNELMDFRRAETGHLRLRVSNLNIVAFAESIFMSFHHASVSRNIQANFNSALPDIDLYVDKEQMEKVLYNLLVNAFKFTPDGGKVNVDVEDEPHVVHISVTNTGKGISPQNIKKLFENYFQEESDAGVNTGYGLGLALSKSILEQHQGLMEVSSLPNNTGSNDTCFKVTLRKGKDHFNPVDLITVNNHFNTLTIQETINDIANNDIAELEAEKKQTIVVVEDNEGIRSFICNGLKAHFQVIPCSNGEEGWEAISREIPDLIVSDVMMPGIDGLELSDLVKSDARTNHIPMILLSAQNTVASQVTGLQRGVELYMTKPFNLEVLYLQVRNLLRTRNAIWEQFKRRYLLPDNLVKEPADDTTAVLHPMDEAFINNLIKIIDDNLSGQDFGVATLSKIISMSQPVLNKKIKAITGLSANDFVKTLRLKKAAQLLAEKRYTVYEIAYMVGYENSKYFSKEFKKQYSVTPTEYIALGSGILV